jgi:hypothetical protein
MRVTKFVLNKKAFRDQILKGAETRALLSGIVGSDGVAEEAPSRARARVYGNLSDEAQNGTLSRAIGRWRL